MYGGKYKNINNNIYIFKDILYHLSFSELVALWSRLAKVGTSIPVADLEFLNQCFTVYVIIQYSSSF